MTSITNKCYLKLLTKLCRLAMDTVPGVLLSIALAALLPMASPDDQLAKENIPHSRQKRILWITNDGRLALPPGTTMTITPSLSMPFVRHPPNGFFSNMTVSFPFTSKYSFYYPYFNGLLYYITMNQLRTKICKRNPQTSSRCSMEKSTFIRQREAICVK